jgi:hypothetical protein
VAKGPFGLLGGPADPVVIDGVGKVGQLVGAFDFPVRARGVPKCGSLETLKVSIRQGLRLWSAQTLAMVSLPTPNLLASDLVVQCVEVSAGFSWQVTRTISATTPSARAGFRPALGDHPNLAHALGGEPGPPTPDGVGVDVAAASDLLVRHPARGPQQRLGLHHFSMRQASTMPPSGSTQPAVLGHQQRRCSHPGMT